MTLQVNVKYPVDRTGKHPDNRVVNERHLLTPLNRTLVPREGYFYAEGLVIQGGTRGDTNTLVLGQDYNLDDLNDILTHETGKSIFTSIVILNSKIMGEVQITYQCYGTRDEFTPGMVKGIIDEYRAIVPRFDEITNRPKTYPFAPHAHPIGEISGWEGISAQLEHIANLLVSHRAVQSAEVQNALLNHRSSINDKLIEMKALLSTALDGSRSVTEFKRQLEIKLAEVNRELTTLRSQSGVLTEIDKTRKELNASLSKAFKDLKGKIDAGLQEKTTELQRGDAEIKELLKAYPKTNWVNTQLTNLSNGLKQWGNTTFPTKVYVDGKFLAIENKFSGYVTLPTYNAGVAAASRKAIWAEVTDKPRLMEVNEVNNRGSLRRDKSEHQIHQYATGSGKELSTIIYDDSGTKAFVQRYSDVGRMWVNGKTFGARMGREFDARPDFEVMVGNPVAVTNPDAEERPVIYQVSSASSTGKPHVSLPKLPSTSGLGVNFKNISLHGQLFFYNTGDFFYRHKGGGSNKWVSHRLITEHYLETTYPNFKKVLSGSGEKIAPGITPEQLNALKEEVRAIYVPLSRLQPRISEVTAEHIPVYGNKGELASKALLIGDTKRPADVATVSYTAGTVTIDKALRVNDLSLLSDKRIKDDICDIDNPLKKVLQLRGKGYRNKITDKPSFGFIAQEVESVLPELVHGTEGGLFSVNYAAVIPLLLEAIRELKQENEMLKERMNKLEVNNEAK